MANNLVRNIPKFSVVVTHPTSPETADPVRVGTKVGVALTDEGEGGNAATKTTVDFGEKVWDLLVDDNAGSGIAVGAKLYYHDTGTGSPATSVNNSSGSADAEVGIALEAISANATDTINVLVTATT